MIMKKSFSYKKILLLVVVLMATLVLSMACTPEESGETPTPATGEFSYVTNAQMSSTDYNKNLYFLNELKFEIADPDVIYIDHGEEEGWFYAYGTSDLVGCFGIQCWRSKDLTNWEYVSVAYQPDFSKNWDAYNHWAPEILFDEELGYLLFYNADNRNDGGRKCIDVAYSENPYGPFKPLRGGLEPAYNFSSSNPLIPAELARQDTIDVHPYIDPVTGDKYLYYSGYGNDGNGTWHGQTIFGIKLNDWLDPDYSTLTELTKLFNSTVDRSDNDIDEGSGMATVNEAPYVLYHDGQYYMTFSVYAYTQEMYQVRQAVADSPLGRYTKIQPEDGGRIIGTDSAWNGVLASAGHHCFIECGDQIMIAYHTFLNRMDIGNGRALAVDTITFVENAKGQTVIHSNGPTYSYQPLPSEISGYENLAGLATVTAENVSSDSNVSYLTDGLIKIHDTDPVNEFETENGNVSITMTFDEFIDARSILIYNSTDYEKAFWGINSIKLHYYIGDDAEGKPLTSMVEIKNVEFDDEWNADTFSEIMYPGANALIEFKDLPINKIEISILADGARALNEIMVLGKKISKPSPVKEFSEYSYSEPELGSPTPVYESATFGSAGKFDSDYGYDLSHDDGTENAYVEKTWCGNLQKLYFKDIVSTNFYVEVELSVLNNTTPYLNDGYPKIGIMMDALSDYFVFFNIDCTANYSGQYVGWVESNDAGKDYIWSNYDGQRVQVGSISYTGDNYTKLAIARLGDECYMFVNDTLAFALKDGALKGFTDNDSTACAVSLLTYNSYTRFRNYSITDNVDEVSAKLVELGITR